MGEKDAVSNELVTAIREGERLLRKLGAEVLASDEDHKLLLPGRATLALLAAGIRLAIVTEMSLEVCHSIVDMLFKGWNAVTTAEAIEDVIARAVSEAVSETADPKKEA